MDLRNRDNYQQIVKELQEVPSERYAQMARLISEIAARDTALDREVVACWGSLEEKSSKTRIAHVGRSQGILRLHVFSTLENANKTFSLRISGELSASSCSFSDFVSRVDIRLPSDNVSWTRNTDDSGEAIEGISVNHRAIPNENATAELIVHVNYRNCLYHVPASLSGKQHTAGYMSFVHLFRHICAYIKTHNLSSYDDPSYFTPDQTLHELLYPNHPHRLPVSFASLLEAIRTHCKVPGPFKIVHKIGSQEQVFDLLVQLPDEQNDNSIPTILSDAERKLALKLNEIDRDVAEITDNLKEAALEAAFLDLLAANPAQYLHQILETPTGINKEVQSTGNIDYLQMATSFEFYKQPWAVAAAAYVINEQKKQQASA